MESSGLPLWVHRIRYALDESKKWFSGVDLDYYERAIGPQIDSISTAVPGALTGRLSQSVQQGGKRRIFAIGNYVNQRLLAPIHSWLMQVLSRLPMDGTFHKSAPLDRLKGSMVCHSLDLTDRFPLLVMFEIFHFNISLEGLIAQV